MNVVERRQRRAELLELRKNDPLQVIAMYRRVVGLNQYSTVPLGMDLTSLVHSILEHEQTSGVAKLTQAPSPPRQVIPIRSHMGLAARRAISVAAGWLGLGLGLLTQAGR